MPKQTKQTQPEPTFNDILDPINDIASEVIDERLAQVERWGQQDHPSFYSDVDVQHAQTMADHWKQRNDARVQADRLTWDGILLEEVYEALAETEPTLRREELIQVAAVAMAEVEAIDRMMGAFDEPLEADSDEEAA